MATEISRINVGNGGYGNNQLILSYDLLSQSVAGNYSTIRLYLYFYAPAWISFSLASAWLHNSGWFGISKSFNAGTYLLKQMDINVAHNADGTKSFNIGFGINTSFIVSGSSSGSARLPTIARATSPTLTYADSQKRLGTTLTINLPRASTSFTHTVKYVFGTLTGMIKTGVATSTAWTLPLTLANQIPNSETGTGTIIVDTFNGSTLIGTKSINFNVKVADDMVPIFESITVNRVDNGVPTSFGVYVESISKVMLTIVGASGSYGSTIKTYSISGGGVSTDKESDTLGPFNMHGVITFSATITDSRGRQVSKTVSITFHEYHVPTLTLEAKRCDSAGIESPTGTYVSITPVYSVASVNNKNAVASKQFEILSTSYVNTACASGAKCVLGEGAIALNKEYTVKGTIIDSIGKKAEITALVKIAEAIMNMKSNGKGIAIGSYATEDEVMKVDWLLKANAGIQSKGHDVPYFTIIETWD